METDKPDDSDAQICPNCGSVMVDEDGQPICPSCNGEIDWGLDDEES